MRLLGVIGLAALAAGCSPFESKLNGVCEDLLKARLRSPSTYSRVEIKKYVDVLPAIEWVAAHKESDARMVAIWERKAGAAAVEGRALNQTNLFISYDAANAYGTAVRGLAHCTYLSVAEDEGVLTSVIGRLEVRLDGFNETEWLTEQIRQSR